MEYGGNLVVFELTKDGSSIQKYKNTVFKIPNDDEFENARKVNEYLAGHQEDIDAEAAQDPAVVAAKSEFDAVEGGSHLYTEKKEAYESALNTARNNVRNRYTEELQKKWNTASKKEGNYYILNETPEQKNARYEAEHGAQAEDKTAPSQEDVKKSSNFSRKS